MIGRVSVIMPVFNSAAFLPETIQNIAAQTHPSIELIAVNDGSSDDTAAVLDDAARRHAFVRPVHCEINGGAYKARNIGLSHATGEFVAFIDADDHLDPQRFETLIAHLTAHDLDMVCDNLEIYDKAAARTTGNLVDFGGRDRAILDMPTFCLMGKPTHHFNIGLIKPVFRRSFIEEKRLRFSEISRSNADFSFVVTALALGARAEMIARPLYRYTAPVGPASGRKSTARRTDAKLTDFIELDRTTIDELAERVPDLDLSPLAAHYARLVRHRAIVQGLRSSSRAVQLITAVKLVTSRKGLGFFVDRALGRRYRPLKIPKPRP